MNKAFEFTLRMFLAAAAFYFILEYVFICNIPNSITLPSFTGVILLVTVLFYLFGNKEQTKMCS